MSVIDETTLWQLAAKGLTDKEMAAHFGADPTSIGRKRRLLGIPNPRQTRTAISQSAALPGGFKWPFTLAHFQECERLGISRVDLAKRLRLDISTVNGRYRTLTADKARRHMKAEATAAKPKPDRFRQWPVLVDDFSPSELPPEDGAPFRKPVLRPRNFAERNDPAFRGLVTA